MQILPRNNQWTQLNNSDNKGSLWVTKGVDFDENEGRVRLSKRIILNTGQSDVATLTNYPAHFQLVGSNMYTIAGLSGGSGYAFYASTTNPLVDTFTKDTDAKAPTSVDSAKSDAIFSNNAYYVTANLGGAATAYKKIGNLAWSTPFTVTVNGGYPNMLCSYRGRTYMSDIQSKIVSWNSSDSVATSGDYTATINVVADFTNLITKLVADRDKIWVLCVNTTGGKGYVYEWDGAAQTMTRGYILESSGALSGVMHKGVLYIMDTNGRLQAFSGGTFQTVATINRENNKLLYNPLSLTNNRFIHPNGMAVINEQIHVLIDNRNYDSTLSTEETIPSGVWVFDENRGLTHKYSLSSNKSSDTLTKFGAYKLSGVGAINEWDLASTSATRNGSFLAGAIYLSNATGTGAAIFYDDLNDTLKKSGYLVSAKLDATDINGNFTLKNTFTSDILTFRKFLTESDKIVLKYRVSEASPTDITGTWTSTTSFTTTTDLSAYWTSGVGGEVEVQTGTGEGICAHITNISGSGTYTVTIDETITGATSTSLIRVQAWKKLASYSSQGETYLENSPDDQANWIQFKVFMWWTGKNELEKMFINNNETLPARK